MQATLEDGAPISTEPSFLKVSMDHKLRGLLGSDGFVCLIYTIFEGLAVLDSSCPLDPIARNWIPDLHGSQTASSKMFGKLCKLHQ